MRGVSETKLRAYPPAARAVVDALVLVATGLAMLAGILYLALTRQDRVSFRPNFHAAFWLPPLVIATAMVAAGVARLWRCKYVRVIDEGVVVTAPLRAARRLRWRDVRRLSRRRKGQFPWSLCVQLVLHDASGAKLATLDSTTRDFDDLADEIEQRCVRAAPTVDALYSVSHPSAHRPWWARLLSIVGLQIFLFSTILALVAAYDRHVDATLRSDGVPTAASILSRDHRDDTYTIVYSFTDRTGHEYAREAALQRKSWEWLEGKSAVGVVYLPSDPGTNRPMLDEAFKPTAGTIKGALSASVVGLFIAALFARMTVKTEKGKRVYEAWGRRVAVCDVRAAAAPADERNEKPPVPWVGPRESWTHRYGRTRGSS